MPTDQQGDKLTGQWMNIILNLSTWSTPSTVIYLMSTVAKSVKQSCPGHRLSTLDHQPLLLLLLGMVGGPYAPKMMALPELGLWTNPPTKSWQCQHFGCIWSPNPFLNRSTDWECRAPLITVSRFSGGQWKKNHFHYFVLFHSHQPSKVKERQVGEMLLTVWLSSLFTDHLVIGQPTGQQVAQTVVLGSDGHELMAASLLLSSTFPTVHYFSFNRINDDQLVDSLTHCRWSRSELSSATLPNHTHFTLPNRGSKSLKSLLPPSPSPHCFRIFIPSMFSSECENQCQESRGWNQLFLRNLLHFYDQAPHRTELTQTMISFADTDDFLQSLVQTLSLLWVLRKLSLGDES